MSVIVTYIGERMKRRTRIEDNEINFESILFLLTDSCLGTDVIMMNVAGMGSKSNYCIHAASNSSNPRCIYG